MDLGQRNRRWVHLLGVLLRPLLWYFRAEVRGLDRLPDGAAVLAANHGGGMSPGDAVFLAAFLRSRGTQEPIYLLAHRLFFRIGLGPLLRRIGVIEASRENARAVLDSGAKLLVYPGGDYDSLRSWSRRRSVDFGGRSGFHRLAKECDVPIVPVVTAGSHHTFLVLTQGKRLATWLRMPRWLGVHSFPVILCLPWGLVVGPLFLLPYLPFPARIVVEVGRPMIARSYEEVLSVLQATMSRLYAQDLDRPPK